MGVSWAVLRGDPDLPWLVSISLHSRSISVPSWIDTGRRTKVGGAKRGSTYYRHVGDHATAKAAVLDASYVAHGRLNIDKVQRLAAQLAARGAELWIPEVVLLEFAVHA